MQNYPSIAWVLLAITCFVTAFGLNPRIRRKWRWGRTSTSIPMSLFGACIGIGVLWMMSATAFGFLPFFSIFLAIPLLLVGALYDSWRNSHSKRRQAKR